MEFIKAFEEIDTDESGEITRSELEEYMKAKNYKPAFVEKWLRIFDADNSGTITLEEFCSTLGLIPGKRQKERIQRRNTLKQLELQVKLKVKDDDNEQNKDEKDNNKDEKDNNKDEKDNNKDEKENNKNEKDNNKDEKENNKDEKDNNNKDEKDNNKDEKENNKDENDTNNNNDDKNQIANEKDKENENINKKEDEKEDEIINLSKTIEVITEVNDDKNKSKKDRNIKAETSEKLVLQLRNDKSDGKTGSTESESSNRVNIRYQIKNIKEIRVNEVYVITEDPDISKHLRHFVLKLCLDTARKFYDELEVAKNVKMILDTNFNKCWHVVAGRDIYGCLVTHEKGMFIHVRAREWGILMWQVQKL